MSARLVVPHIITIIALPSKCPELNPEENVWEFMRDNWLSIRVFKSYDDLVDHCCDAWNLSTPEQKCIGSPEQRYISDAGKKAPELGAFSSGIRLGSDYPPGFPRRHGVSGACSD